MFGNPRAGSFVDPKTGVYIQMELEACLDEIDDDEMSQL